MWILLTGWLKFVVITPAYLSTLLITFVIALLFGFGFARSGFGWAVLGFSNHGWVGGKGITYSA